MGRNWQVLIKIAGRKRKQTNRSAYAYEARTVQGNCIFLGTFSCAAKTALSATQEALMDTLLKARDMGYQRILVLCNSRRLVQVSNLFRAPNCLSHTTTTTTGDASWSSLLLFQGFLVAFSLLIAPTPLPLMMLITGVTTIGGYQTLGVSQGKQNSKCGWS
ncbi:hypothetical protein CMV_012021 [Castanea mollissima]|uniref:Uncharacterized protein n=1 Tax=Castanea mollissima TaxID=60419 RepID=A0A8J4R2U6_9ROSI|nr:hypothetical protein CMV_012021 [Castanea mollissima]